MRASQESKESACQCKRHRRHGFHPWVGMIPWRRKWQPSPAFLARMSHGRRSLVGYGPPGHKEADRTQQARTSGALAPETGRRGSRKRGQKVAQIKPTLSSRDCQSVRPGSNPKHPYIQRFHYSKEGTGQEGEEKLQSHGQLPAETNLDSKFPVSFCPSCPFICHNWEDNSSVLKTRSERLCLECCLLACLFLASKKMLD